MTHLSDMRQTLIHFAVTNHGVPDALLEQQFRESAAFFAQPLREKLNLQVHGRGSLLTQYALAAALVQMLCRLL